MTYIKKIDTIRAIAVLTVVISHWIPKTASVVEIGRVAVDVFFVIS
jgi:peptidoglycan/LPS O-acetylase OafA/YrhL